MQFSFLNITYCVLYWFFLSCSTGYCQLSVSVSSTLNYKCDGMGCEYNGPSILINEVQACPASGNGSMVNSPFSFSGEGEWIELYNPNACLSVDISYYFLGNNSFDMSNNYGDNFGGGLLLPAYTIIPPNGFCLIRGKNAPAVPPELLIENGGNTVEIVADSHMISICLDGGFRLWFPDNGGWFAFYDRNGVPQDAISWASLLGTCMDCNPCTPDGSPSFSGKLPSYTHIPVDRKNYIYKDTLISEDRTLCRIPDGGNWLLNERIIPTMGTCNAECMPKPLITCNGTVTASATGGTPPYQYVWDDGRAQSTATAIGLCAGTYTVTLTDQNNHTVIEKVEVQNFQPQITFLDTSVSNQLTVHILDTEQNTYLYALNQNEFQLSNVFYQILDGFNTLHVKDLNLCMDSIHFLYVNKYINIPNFFTPNNDGINDTWEIEGIHSFPKAIIRIFDRLGKLLATYHGTDRGWNGFYNGNRLKPDDYWYIIELNNHKNTEYKGHVTLLF